MKDYQKLLDTVDILSGIIAEKNISIDKLQNTVTTQDRVISEQNNKIDELKMELIDAECNCSNCEAVYKNHKLSGNAKMQAGLPPYEPKRDYAFYDKDDNIERGTE